MPNYNNFNKAGKPYPLKNHGYAATPIQDPIKENDYNNIIFTEEVDYLISLITNVLRLEDIIISHEYDRYAITYENNSNNIRYHINVRRDEVSFELNTKNEHNNGRLYINNEHYELLTNMIEPFYDKLERIRIKTILTNISKIHRFDRNEKIEKLLK